MVAAHAKKLYVIKESKTGFFYSFLWVKIKKTSKQNRQHIFLSIDIKSPVNTC